MAQDYSSLSDNDLKALYNDDYTSISDEGLKTLYKNISDPDTSNTDRTVLKGGIEKKVNLRPSNIMNNIVDYSSAAITTPLNMLTKKNDLQTAYNEELQSSKDFRAKQAAEHPIMTNFDNGIKDFAGYALLPAANVFKGAGLLPKVANAALTGGYQGGVIGGIDSLANKGDFLSGATEGAAVGGALGGAFPLIGGAFNKVKDYGTSTLIPKALRIKPETLTQLVKPDSKALDINVTTIDDVQGLLNKLTKQVRNNYQELLNKKAKVVEHEKNNLKNKKNIMISADDLKGDITNIFDKYQKDEINPARELVGNLENDLFKIVDKAKNKTPLYNFKPETLQAIKNIINGSDEEIVLNMRNDLEKLGGTNDISIIFGNDKKGLRHIADKHGKDIVLKVIDAVENGKINKYVPGKKTVHLQKGDIEAILSLDEHGKQKSWILTGWNKKVSPDVKRQVSTDLKTTQTEPTFSRQDLGAELDNIIAQNEQYLNSVSPLSLQGLKEIMNNSIDWSIHDTISKNLKNPILQLLYGKYKRRLDRVVPELEEANKNYAYLKKFEETRKTKNSNVEDVSDIVNKSKKIKTAATTLKNYKNLVTGGERRASVEELEKALTNEGYKPFLKQIDDINAAQDLNHAYNTGADSHLQNTIAKLLFKPILRGQRALNRRPYLADLYKQLALSNNPELRIPLIYTLGDTIFEDDINEE